MKKSWYKWEVLGLLWFAFFLNQADRQIYNTLLGDISEFLQMTPAHAGLVATLFTFTMAVFTPVFGFFADRFSKKWIVVFAVLLWSFATVFSGACTGVLGFIIFRSIATGMGEAAFGPANYALLADYHKESRATAMSIHQTAYYFGVIASGGLAAWIASNWGWHSAFFVFGSVGVVFGLVMMLRLRDKTPDEDGAQTHSQNAAHTKPTMRESVKIFFTTPTVVCLALAYTGVIFVLQAYLTWTTLFLQEKFGVGIVEAGFGAVFYTHIAAFVGILIAGRLSDKLALKRPPARMMLQCVGLVCAAPFLAAMGFSENIALVYAGFFGFGFFRAFFDANTYSVLYDVVPVRFRASATGIKILVGFGLGSLAPWIMGIIKMEFGLSVGIASLSLVWLFFGLVLLAGFKLFYQRDFDAARRYDAEH